MWKVRVVEKCLSVAEITGSNSKHVDGNDERCELVISDGFDSLERKDETNDLEVK